MTKKMQETNDDFGDIELPVDQALGIWFDLERALEGKNGYGGDVAEIYAYRLVPPRHKGSTEEEQARVAGRNLTRLLRYFVDLHRGAEIEDADESRVIDPLAEDFPPFAHRTHLRVLRGKLIRREFAADLVALWRRGRDLAAHLPQPDFGTWDSATKFLLLALGVEDAGEAPVIRGDRCDRSDR